MANAGYTIENPLTGERITFLEIPSETNGDLLRFDWRIPPGFSIPEHVHVRQEERHEILTGTLRGRVAGQERVFILLDEAGGEFYPTGVPMPVWRACSALVTALARAGRLLGYEAYSPGRRASAGPMAASRWHGGRALPLVSALWLLNAAAGAAVPIREDLPGEFAGMTRWQDPPADFLKGAGTALSPGLPMMAAQAAFTVLSTRGGRAGTVGLAGTTALGAGATIGVLGEPITYKVLTPGTFDPKKAAIVSAAIVLSPLMAVLGARRLLASRGGR